LDEKAINTINDVDLTETSPSKATKQETEEVTQWKKEQSGMFSLRKHIGHTIYEVSAHFSSSSRETLEDKILRLARNGALK
jgi:hypothetical protein